MSPKCTHNDAPISVKKVLSFERVLTRTSTFKIYSEIHLERVPRLLICTRQCVFLRSAPYLYPWCSRCPYLISVWALGTKTEGIHSPCVETCYTAVRCILKMFRRDDTSTRVGDRIRTNASRKVPQQQWLRLCLRLT